VSDRHLLLLTYHFPPSAASGSYRLLGFARHLRRYGWRISVIAPPSLPWEPVDQRLQEQLPADVAVHSVTYPRGRVGKVFRRIAKFGVWLPHALRRLRRVVADSRPDAVLTSGPPHCVHALGLYAKCWLGLPWAADFRDPWVVGDPQEQWRSPRVWCARRWERKFLRHADLVVSNAPRARTMLQSAYPGYREKVVTITNGFDPDGFPQRSPRAADRTEISIVHAGEIYFGRDPRPFLDALCKLATGIVQHGRMVRMRFLGRATEGYVNLEDEIRSRGLTETVTVEGQVTYEASRRIMSEADILLLLDSPGRKVGVPAKLYEYLGAGAAILALTEEDGDAAWVLRQSGLTHRIVPPHQPDQILLALCELVDCVRTQEGSMPSAQRTAMFTRAATAGALAEHLDLIMRAESKPKDCHTGRQPAIQRTESVPSALG
jgi:glycosyltransferase involved in cell wall biosynthesis